MLRNQNQPSFLGAPRHRHATPGRGRPWRYRPSVERLEVRVVLSGANEIWYPSTNPSQPFAYGAAGWVPVSFGNGNYAVVDTSGKNSLAPGNDVWYLSTNPTHPFAFGGAGWVPIGFSNGTYAAVDTSGDNSVAPGNDVWYLSTNPSQPFAFGGAGWVPISFGTSYAAVDTSGDNSVDPGNDVWYLFTNPSHPFAYGAAGWVPVSFGNGTYDAVDTSGNNSLAPGNDVWYPSTNPSHPFAYGGAGWVPLALSSSTYDVVNTSGGTGAAPNPATSPNWSGYAATTPTDAVSNVRGSWYLPTVTGSGTTYSATWVGIDGDGSQTLEQTGTAQDVVSGVAQYYAWYEMIPNPPVNLPASSYPVRAGDLMAANVTYVGDGQFNLDISDRASNGALNWNFNTTQTPPSGYTAVRSSAEWIEEAPSSSNGVLPLANFGSVTFSNMLATISGGTLPISTGNIDDQGNTNYLLNITGSAGTATTSQLNSDGNGFTVDYGSSTPPPPSTGPDIGYYGPMQRLSMDSGTASAASALAPLSLIAPVGTVVGVPGSVPLSTVADLPAQAVQPSTGLFASVVGRKLPPQGSPFSSSLSSEDRF